VDADRDSRNEAFFGAEGQRRITATRVAIVGTGGLGSHVAQQLAYLGVLGYGLIDFDTVTDSSLNRLIGAGVGDVGALKIAVAERMIKGIRPTADVQLAPVRLDDPRAEHLIRDADIVFGVSIGIWRG
jgi:molybdopterin-synthase adenylyltransferase